ncbi:signal peptidase II [Sphingomonas sinipercae]|uniref:Lipoprotein signal peptidase n=1 Tax=Sphingomonas sinipercae TaxID=2714944 RepID=A0A6G7ZQD8_9SPHN|nr:signal peptidase II [Sphingomonas sinipercae]QIL03116.1 signal peptidase II [Sphingomonas sinipercae]
MRNARAGLIVAAFVFIADQLTKWLVLGPLNLREVQQVYLLPFFNLTYTENNGISLGLFNATTETGRWMLVAMTAAIAIGVAVWMAKEKVRADQAALGMILGGALGNILDRARHGYVVDFADLHFGAFRPFLVFNVSDAAITIGVVILLLRAFLVRDEKVSSKESVENA